MRRGWIARPLLATTAAALLAACGDGDLDGTAGSSATPTTTAAPSSPSASQTLGSSGRAEAFLVPLEGFTYRDVPAQVDQRFRQSLGTNPQTQQLLQDYAIKAVVPSGRSQATVVVIAIAVDEESAANPGLEAGFVAGLAGSAGAEPEEGSLEDQEVSFVDARQQGLFYVLWQQDTFLVSTFGPDEEDARDVAEALIKATA